MQTYYAVSRYIIRITGEFRYLYSRQQYKLEARQVPAFARLYDVRNLENIKTIDQRFFVTGFNFLRERDRRYIASI